MGEKGNNAKKKTRDPVWDELFRCLMRYKARGGERDARLSLEGGLDYWVACARMLRREQKRLLRRERDGGVGGTIERGGGLAVNRIKLLEIVNFASAVSGKRAPPRTALGKRASAGVGLVDESPAPKKGRAPASSKDKPRAKKAFDDDCEDDASWLKHFHELAQYRAENGDCLVPEYGGGGEDPLARWVTRMRQTRRRVQLAGTDGGRLTKKECESRIMLLDSIGFDWGPTAASGERARAGAVEESPPPTQAESGKRTVAEVDESPAPKKARAKKKFDDDYEDDASWQKYFYELVQYRAENGDCLVPMSHGGGGKESLAHWVARMRQMRRVQLFAGTGGGCLTKERVRMLDSLGFKWRAPVSRPRPPDAKPKPAAADRKKSWDEMLRQLEAGREWMRK